MTIDEAIKKHCEEAIRQKSIANGAKHLGVSYESIEHCEQCTVDNRQLAEWLTELKEAKRLLKAAVEDFAMYGALKDLSAEQRVQNPDWRRFNRVFDALSHQWRYADEALALIGEEGDTSGRV